MQVTHAGTASQQVDTASTQLPRARSRQQEPNAPLLDQPVHLVQQARQEGQAVVIRLFFPASPAPAKPLLGFLTLALPLLAAHESGKNVSIDLSMFLSVCVNASSATRIRRYSELLNAHPKGCSYKMPDFVAAGFNLRVPHSNLQNYLSPRRRGSRHFLVAVPHPQIDQK